MKKKKRYLRDGILLWALIFIFTRPALLAQETSTKLLLKPLPNAYGQLISPEAGAENGLVLIFTNHDCTYSKLYMNRLNALSSTFQEEGIRFIAVESSVVSFESTSNSLNNYLDKEEISFPYLIDLNNEMANSFGAESSPHAFFIIKKEGDYEIVYSGSIDNNSRKPEKVTKQYLKDAIVQTLASEPVKYPRTKAIGCYLGTN